MSAYIYIYTYIVLVWYLIYRVVVLDVVHCILWHNKLEVFSAMEFELMEFVLQLQQYYGLVVCDFIFFSW